MRNGQKQRLPRTVGYKWECFSWFLDFRSVFFSRTASAEAIPICFGYLSGRVWLFRAYKWKEKASCPSIEVAIMYRHDWRMLEALNNANLLLDQQSFSALPLRRFPILMDCFNKNGSALLWKVPMEKCHASMVGLIW